MTKALVNALREDLSVLFVNIGWARAYDGSEAVVGDHGYFKDHDDAFETEAFLRQDDGQYHCKLGRGAVHDDRLHVVYISVDPVEQRKKIVGVYAAARVEGSGDAGDWPNVVAKHALVLPIGSRPRLASWPGNQGMRRWARSATTKRQTHAALLRQFKRLARDIESGRISDIASPDETDMQGHEGEETQVMRRHRKRERKLRAAKIREAMRANGGRLICETPRCGFDFEKVYGQLGRGHAHVHHLDALGRAPRKGVTTPLSRLAIVCANCHDMIHRGGENRPLRAIIPV